MSRSRSSSNSSGAREVQAINTNRNTFDAESIDRPLIQKRHSEPSFGKKEPVLRFARRKSAGDKTRGHEDILRDSPRSSISSLGGSKTIKYKGRRKSRRKSTRKRRRIFF